MNIKTLVSPEAAFETYLLTEKRLTKNSVSAYMTDVRQLKAYLQEEFKVSLIEAEEQHLKSYVRLLHKQQSQPKTIARKISAFKVLYLFLEDRYAAHNSAEGLIIPRIDKTLPVYLTREEVLHLMKVAREDESPKGRRNCVMLQLLYATGLRITELVTLRLDSLRLDIGFVSVIGKGGRQREIPLPLPIVEIVKKYIDEQLTLQMQEAQIIIGPKTLLFPIIRKGKSQPITRQSFWGILKKFLVLSGITKNVSPHTLRHSIATHLLQAGADIRSLQLWLGHEQMSTVEIYTHLDKTLVRKTYDHKHPRA